MAFQLEPGEVSIQMVRSAWWRLFGLFRRQKREQELAAEIESHLQMRADDNMREGMDAEQARRNACLELGGVERTKQAWRERDTIPWIESLLQDLRFATRQLRMNKAFSATAILMLALGMGASVAIFAFVDAALIKPLPYADPAMLVSPTETVAMMGRANLSYPDYLDWKRMNKVFTSLDVVSGAGFLVSTPAGMEPVRGVRTSDGLFRTLGVQPMLGRDFYPGEDLPAAPKTVILTYDSWLKRFSARTDVIGQTINLSGTPHTVVGVLPPTFHFAFRGAAEFYVPLHPAGDCDLRRSCHSLIGIARLKDGVTVAMAQANIQAIAKQLEMQYPGDNRGQGASVISLAESITGDIRPILLVLLAGAALLLLIACVNVSSLLLVRSESRKREIAVRGALGASRGRLARQFITEGLLLVSIASLLGVAGADAGMCILLHLISRDMLMGMPYLRGLGLNPHVLLFAAAIALFAVVLFSITPLARMRWMQLRDGLTEGSRGAAGTLWRRMGANLVIVELATAVVLLAGAGLLGKSFYRLLHVSLGFQPDHLATLQVSLAETSYQQDSQKVSFEKAVLDRVKGLPGVQSAAFASMLPVSCNCDTDWIRFVGKPYHGEHNEVNTRDVSAGYFTTVQARLLRGRYFTEADDASKPLVIVINKKLADTYFPGEDPIGRKVANNGLDPKSMREIVGVVDDIRDGALDSNIWPSEYEPIYQTTDNSFVVVVRTSQDAGATLEALRSAIHQVDPGVGLTDEMTMQQKINDSPSAALHRSSAWLVGGFALLALLLSAIGLYGVIAYSVSQRTREIGVRMALGAQRSMVYGLILKEAGWLILLGIGAGLACSIGTSSLMGKVLFGVSAWDGTTLAGVAGVLAIAAILASYLPARRAASVNPVEALRAE